MSANTSKASLIRKGLAASILLMASGLSFSQSVVSLTASQTTTKLPDGQVVQMWGYSCGAGPSNATCAAANPNAAGTWSPVVITIPSSSTSLTISLTNSLQT